MKTISVVPAICPKAIGKDGSEHLGLRLVTNFVENISYKYMYGLNIVTIMV